MVSFSIGAAQLHGIFHTRGLQTPQVFPSRSVGAEKRNLDSKALLFELSSDLKIETPRVAFELKHEFECTDIIDSPICRTDEDKHIFSYFRSELEIMPAKLLVGTELEKVSLLSGYLNSKPKALHFF